MSGDTVNHAKSQLLAWEVGAKGLDVHALAEPTKLEALKRENVMTKTELNFLIFQEQIDFALGIIFQPSLFRHVLAFQSLQFGRFCQGVLVKTLNASFPRKGKI